MAAGEYPTGFTLTGSIRESIREGLSMRAGIERFRFANGRDQPQTGYISNQAYREAFKLEREAMAAGPRLADLDPRSVPDSGMFTDWKFGQSGRKFAQVRLQIFDTSIGGIVDQHWVVGMDDNMSIQDALDRAADQYAFGQDDEGSPYSYGRVTTVQLTGLRNTI